jgi:RimJ/RimL family protein N-acetyltransferase
VNAAHARAGLRVCAADAFELRLTAALAGSPLPFPADGIGDGVVVLRPLRPADAAVLARYTDRPPAEWLAEQDALVRAGLALDLAVVERAANAMVGLLQLQRFDWPNHRASIGLWLLPEARGRGFMTRALPLLVDWVFTEGILDRIEYLSQADNQPSLRLAERSGFVREGELRACLV